MPSLRLWFLMVLPFALWGTAMTAMAPLLASAGPWLVAGLRLVPAGLALLLWVQCTGRGLAIDSRDWPWFLLFTLVDATLFQGLLARGLEGTGAGLGSVLIDCQPLLVALMARALFMESINPIGWMGLAIGLAGIVCIGLPAELLGHWWLLADPPVLQQLFQPGEGWMLLAAVAMAAGTVLIRFASRHSDPVSVTAWHMVLGGLPLLGVHALQRTDAGLAWTATDWARMGYASLLGSALAYGLFFWFANQRDLTSFSSLGFLTPVFALATGGWLLGERLDLLQWIGVVMVLVSVIFVSQRRRFWEPLSLADPLLMTVSPLHLVIVNTPIGALGSGEGGGVELTLRSLVQGLVRRGHRLTVVAAKGSTLPADCSGVELLEVEGVNQPSWQHAAEHASVEIPRNGLLPALWEAALDVGKSADAVINGGYDWLPLWLTQRVSARLFHLVSMGDVAAVMRDVIEAVASWDSRRLAFHTHRQAADFRLPSPANVVGNGFDLSNYSFQRQTDGPLGWAGRIAPEKGLEDAAAAAAALGEQLLVWGLREDDAYARQVETSVPKGTIDWRGFRSTRELQQEMGHCRALINTPKWNEAYGNVVVEALACGVPVVAYDRGGPGELICSGRTGWLVPPDDVAALTEAIRRVDSIERSLCRSWVEEHASCEVFSQRVESWVRTGLMADVSINRRS